MIAANERGFRIATGICLTLGVFGAAASGHRHQATPAKSEPVAPIEVVAEPNPCLPGQTVTFYVRGGAEKITVHGGSFTRVAHVTGSTSTTDIPKRSTTYTFDVWYSQPKGTGVHPAPQPPVPDNNLAAKPAAQEGNAAAKPAAPEGKAASNPSAADQSAPQTPTASTSASATPPGDSAQGSGEIPTKSETPTKTTGEDASSPPEPTPGHHTCKVSVEVVTGTFPHWTTYRDPHHWRIDVVAGWNRYEVPQEDPRRSTLVYFQPGADSAERIAVAMMPVKDKSGAQLMRRALSDAPTQYDVLKDIEQSETAQCGIPATRVTFSGLDRTLPDVPTRSIVVAFVRDGVGYIINGRAPAKLWDRWEKPLRCLVRSFAFDLDGEHGKSAHGKKM